MEESYNSDYDSFHRHHSKKRKSANVMDDTDESESCSTLRALTPTDESSKKQNHSEIEKRRRDKMNTFITELSGLVPMCNAMSRKLDKLTVLRMAVQHMKTLRGSRVHSYTEGHYKPSFITDQELKRLILHCAEGFLFVVGCDRGRLLYVSESVLQVLKFNQTDLLGQSWFDILHPKDVAKVKEQLSSSDLSPRERLIDAKTMLPVKANVPQKTNRLCPGARRSFFCRMKCKLGQQIKEENDSMNSCYRRKKSNNTERKYTVIHCTGYLKSWAKIGMDETETESDDACNLSCLVAVGRILPQSSRASLTNFRSRPMCYISRHTSDGKFVFVDPRATLVLGFLPQELLGTSMYEYYDGEEMAVLAEAHKTALRCNETISTPTYQFRTRTGTYVKLHSTWKAFRNPWTKETEYLLARNTLISCPSYESPIPRLESLTSRDFDMFANGTGSNGSSRDIQRMITDQMEASKIGKSIADEILDSSRRMGESSCSVQEDKQDFESLSPANMLRSGDVSGILNSSASDCPSDGGTDRDFAAEIELKKKSMSVMSGVDESPRSSSHVSRSRDEEAGGSCLTGAELSSESPHHTSSSDGNDEAAMAVIMSLLEADAGLGGPIDFSGLPWPLP